MTYLSKMAPGQRGRIIGFAEDSKLARRLLELGIIPGRLITYLRNAPLNDPMEVQVGPSCLLLRRREAALVTVEPEE